MKLPKFLLNPLRERLMRLARSDRKYFHLPSDENPEYMERFWVKKPKVTEEGSFGRDEWAARLHIIKSSDMDRHLHDHPWWNASIILEGSYVEEVPGWFGQDPLMDSIPGMNKFLLREPGDVVFRKATDRHRLTLITSRVVSLFIMAPAERMWGFHTEEGFIPFREYLAQSEKWGRRTEFNDHVD